MNKKLLILVTLIMVFVPATLAQDKAGTAGMPFLKIDVTARAFAMGGAFIGLSDDASTLYYNPAGLMNLKSIEFVSAYNMYLADIAYSYAGVTYPLPQLNASMGMQMSYLTTGDMDETTIEFPDGTGRTFSAYDFMVGATYAQMMTPKFFVGGTLKLLGEGLADQKVYTVAGDVGTYYNTGWETLVFGMSIRNFGGNYSYFDEDTPLPMLFVFGLRYAPMDDGVNKLDVLLEAAHPSDNSEYMTLGLEYSYNNMFFIRFGRKFDNDEYWIMKADDAEFPDNADIDNDPELDYSDSGVNLMGTSLGIGFNMESMGIKIDYGWKHMGDLGMTHMITFGYALR
ncbi:MAG: PorV/PorQ family protein [Candidatus Delongbacteria bacterium]|nr:PorV/PorQ family protein [Candidatus Delongbacteria bacterium]